MNNLVEDEIVEIELVGSVDTVDIAVSDDNLFIANGILTHNSGYSVSEPGLTTLSESYAVGTTADFVGSVWQGEGDNDLGIMRMSLLKSRFGTNSGTNAFKIDYSTLKIKEDKELNNMTQDSESVMRTLDILRSDLN